MKSEAEIQALDELEEVIQGNVVKEVPRDFVDLMAANVLNKYVVGREWEDSVRANLSRTSVYQVKPQLFTEPIVKSFLSTKDLIDGETSLQGFTITSQDPLILISEVGNRKKKSEFLQHEVIHALANKPDTFSTGFRDTNREHALLNEHATQALHYSANTEKFENIFDTGFDNWDSLALGPYGMGVATFLSVLMLTYAGGNAMTEEEIAKYYFSQDKTGEDFIEQILERIPEEYKIAPEFEQLFSFIKL